MVEKRSKSLLIIFVKNPVPGKVKTRLAASIGKHKATIIYKELLQHTYRISFKLEIDIVLFYADQVDSPSFWPAPHKKKLQKGNDLGERMSNASKWAFDNRYEKVIIIGSDCYDLSKEIIESAFLYLGEKTDVIIGPCFDGGYYLIGMNAHRSILFTNITWSTSTVLAQTLRAVDLEKLSIRKLPILSDIDTIQDLRKYPSLLQLVQ